VLEGPALELIPLAPELGPRSGGAPAPMGAGYTHALAWTFVFERPPDSARWEVVLDARSGEVLSFQDVNDYAERQIKGGTYPLTSTEVCPDADRCGTMRSNPMPFADTGFAAPNDFANSAGMYDYTSGTATTTLSGRFVRIQDACGALSARSSSGTINLGGATGQHDCEPASGGGAGNTAAARTSFYELNKVAELARGWLPGNPWLNAPLTANVNGDETCNAFWNGSTVTLHRAGDGCRNMGEIASVLDHEWAHGLDDNDANGTRGASREGLADIAALYRLETSCVSYGFRQSPDQGCGATADGTGVNANEAQVGASYCATDCSGARDADFARHTPAVAATALGFVCRQCDPGPGACGRQRHCSAAPVRQAAWDLAARDLTAAPFNLDSRTAFIVANKLFYTGSGNIGDWHACTCPSAGSAGASNGCRAGNGFIQWLTADDDNGFLLDGTPHLTAIRAAHNRHGIGCPIPGGGNSGCAGGPSAAPALTAAPRDGRVALSWSAVPGATRYWVFRTEGHAACDLGKVRIAEVTGTSFTDRSGAPGGISRGPGVANDRPYYYQVMAVGSSSACFSRASNCAQATPGPPGFALSCPSTASVVQGGRVAVSCRVFSSRGFDRAVTLSCLDLPPGIACRYEPNPVTPPADGVVSSTLTLTASSRVPLGSHVITVHGLAGSRSQSVLFLSVTPNDEAWHDPGREVSADGPRHGR
jgi:trimeric autotransporter adhesin